LPLLLFSTLNECIWLFHVQQTSMRIGESMFLVDSVKTYILNHFYEIERRKKRNREE
jgi:hypothetical protein